MDRDAALRNRREFLKAGVAGVAGAALMPHAMGQDQASSDPPAKVRSFPCRVLGRTGLKLPVVSMGVMNADNPNLVRAALDAGIVHLDTAHGYQRGRNEEMIGGVIKGRPRDSYVIGTKVVPDGADRRTGQFTAETRPEPFVEKFELSLKRLGLDHVDIFYLHNVSTREAALFEPLLAAMAKLKEQGKARFLGLSTHRNEPEVIRAAVAGKVLDVVLTAYNFRQPHLADMHAAMAEAAAAGVGLVAKKTHAGAFWDKERQHPINMKAALKWALRNPHVGTAIPGFTTFDQLEEDLAVMADLTLSPKELDDLKQGEKLGVTGLYCRQCGECVAQCRLGLDIPAAMRGYMYAYGYRNLAEARTTVAAAVLPADACGDCDRCTVRCAMGHDIRGRVADIARITAIPEDFLV